MARVALETIEREYPAYVAAVVTGPEEGRRLAPRELHPSFYGSYDWHSCVEMHWALARLLVLAPDHVPADAIRAVFDRHLAPGPLAGEVAFFARPDHRTFHRPYGWGWLLALHHELATSGRDDGARWAAALDPLADLLAGHLAAWLPSATYPIRSGLHPNTAFGLSRALPYAVGRAERDDAALADAIRDAALRWYAEDADYPAAWEPSGSDFLSPALTEAVLMSQLLDPPAFQRWLTVFLPGLEAGEPATLFTPVIVSDNSDGQIAHLHGLNLSRAWCFLRIADALGEDDARAAVLRVAIGPHADASLPAVAGDDYMVEHWLACYAVLLLGDGAQARGAGA